VSRIPKQNQKALVRKMITAQEAKRKEIFVIEGFEEIKKTNLYDFVMESAEETTSPRGIENCLHILPRELDCPNEDCDRHCEICNGTGIRVIYEVRLWVAQSHSVLVEEFETREEAENQVFQTTFQIDFANDCNRRTDFYEKKEEAESEMIQSYAEVYQIDLITAQSIFRHKECKEKIKVLKTKEKTEENEREFQRVKTIAKEYAKLLKPQRETYDQTCSRLSKAVKGKIENKVFHTAVKMIRSRFHEV